MVVLLRRIFLRSFYEYERTYDDFLAESVRVPPLLRDRVGFRLCLFKVRFGGSTCASIGIACLWKLMSLYMGHDWDEGILVAYDSRQRSTKTALFS